jgi:hypothetical protein
MDFNVFVFLGILVAVFVLVGVSIIAYWATTNALQEQDE